MKGSNLNPMALGLSSAAIGAIGMLLLGVGGNIDIYRGAAQMMMQWHMFFNFGAVGIVGGMIEAAIICFVGGYAFAVVYNALNK